RPCLMPRLALRRSSLSQVHWTCSPGFAGLTPPGTNSPNMGWIPHERFETVEPADLETCASDRMGHRHPVGRRPGHDVGVSALALRPGAASGDHVHRLAALSDGLLAMVCVRGGGISPRILRS